MLKFGTDGVRGVANADLTPELVLALGRTAARVLGGSRFFVGRDTRISGPLLHAALAAGLASEGADVVDLGVVPTPAVAHLSKVHGVGAAMISASHNPYPDNGIKLFQKGGMKLSDAQEETLEAELERLWRGGDEAAATSRPVPTGDLIGTLSSAPDDAADAYRDHLLGALEGRTLAGVHVVLDCANGASSGLAKAVFTAAGARVDVIHASPDGSNINDGCGSTHPQDLQAGVVERDAHVGLAFDGDADRVLAVDHAGTLVDGDQMMAICARDMHARGRLDNDTLVVTVMSNLGLRLAMAEAGIEVVETAVGDRYVLEAMEAGGHILGGEQSGHVIFRELATTGDGMLTGLMLLDVVARAGMPLADLASTAMTRLPQVLRNVKVGGPAKEALRTSEAIAADVAAVEAELGDRGRVLLRPSGTEPLVRVMVEAPTAEQAEAAADRLAATVAAALT